ncbi:MAG: polysaccharide export protein, partial [Gammaproteobacteria bacterium]|nr:polysaccharide export protein [Gammaproteobacteria bacterium]
FCADDYQLGAGDIINVTIYNEPDLSLGDIKIPPQGKISFPLLGEIKVSGLTVRQLEKRLYKKLVKGYLKKPSISINIVTYRPFFVSGQVKNPGAFPYINGLTIQKAISISGGFTERASKGKIILIHEKDSTENKITDLNLPVRPGDILLIGESLF